MDNSWDNYDPAPCEFFHSKLMEAFHEFRRAKVGNETTVPIDGIQLGDLIAHAKNLTYAKYPGEGKARPKLR